MRNAIILYFFTGFMLLIFSCQAIEENYQEQGREVSLEYASGFRIEEYEGYKKVEVLSPFQGANSGFAYYLVPRNGTKPENLEGKIIIQVPVESIVCTSTTHIPLLEYLGVIESLKGFPNTDYISSKKVRQMVDEGKITDLGREQGINLELLIAEAPEMVMGYLMTGDMGQLGKIEQMGIPVVINAEYLEPHPLGRAEWIKFAAAFYDKAAVADSIFAGIVKGYERAVEMAKVASARPSVFSGVVYGDTWFLPGGKNYASQIIFDAGGKYLWASDSSSGFLELGFESVYEKASNAEYWIGTASYNSLQALREGDVRYEMFDAFKSGNVFSYNKRIGDKGGNEYLELGYLRPDLILNDLVMILHPEYYQKDKLFFFMPLLRD
jgi:cobalamin transport system substrate-binding protein